MALLCEKSVTRLPSMQISGPLWFASDLHLGPNTPETTAAFGDFLTLAANEAAALFLPGDIFDAWIGDDAAASPPPWLAAVQAMLARATTRLPLWLGRGNRDFLLGERFAQSVGARLLPDAVVLESDGGAWLVSHGDEYCTDDAAYQQFRAMVRNPAWQAQFLGHSIPERLALAAQARGASMAANQTKSAEIMDVNAAAVAEAFRQTGVTRMLHGHTHRPARHVMAVDGQRCERWVLPDWDCDHASHPRGGWLALDADGAVLYDLSVGKSR